MPFASTQVLHPEWAAAHRPVTEGAMNATCEVATTSAGGWDPDLGGTPGTSTVSYAGRCRVQYAASQGNDAETADQLTTARSVVVSLPASAPPQREGARIKVTAVDDNGLPGLVGRTFRVVMATPSSLAFSQDLVCEDDQGNQPVGG